MKILVPLLLLLLASCNGPERRTRVYPTIGLEHLQSHRLQARAGVLIESGKHDVRFYWAPNMYISDHYDTKVKLDNPSAFGFEWRMTGR